MKTFTICLACISLLCDFVEVKAHDHDDSYEYHFQPFRPSYPKSCAQIKQRYPESLSGEYRIRTADGRIRVYCEMALGGGGFTFLPRTAINNHTRINLADHITDSTKVLCRGVAPDGTQPVFLVQQLPEYRHIPISLQINANVGYATPENAGIGSYLFLGFVPAKDAAIVDKNLGYTPNGYDTRCVNKDGKPSNHFALYPNHKELQPSTKNKDTSPNDFFANLFAHPQYVYSHRKMPNEYFMLTELNFDGCGTYWQTDYGVGGKRFEGEGFAFY